MAKVTLHKDDDPEIVAAGKLARMNFRYFWRELSWEYRRIVPGLELAAIKVPFTDTDEQDAEVMWVSDVNFDGYRLTGTLLNQPNWLKSVNEGDPVKVPPKAICDWIYALDEKAYGGFTVNSIRGKMSKKERKAHDNAWGLDFGDPSQVHMVPPDWFNGEQKKPGFLGKMFAKPLEPLSEKELQLNEHPMAAAMAESLTEFFKSNPGKVNEIQDNGLNMFHQLVLSGTAVGVKTALKNGADINGKSARGHTPLAFAKSLGWKKVAMLLHKNGGK